MQNLLEATAFRRNKDVALNWHHMLQRVQLPGTHAITDPESWKTELAILQRMQWQCQKQSLKIRSSHCRNQCAAHQSKAYWRTIEIRGKDTGGTSVWGVVGGAPLSNQGVTGSCKTAGGVFVMNDLVVRK